MAWIATDSDGEYGIYTDKPIKGEGQWLNYTNQYVTVDEMVAELLIGKSLTWDDEPVEIKTV